MSIPKNGEKEHTSMEFIEFKRALQKKFADMTKEAAYLFQTAVDKDELWNVYLDSYPAGTNEIFRERREYDCSCCKSFIRNIGNVVLIKNNQIHTIWDVNLKNDAYQAVADALSRYVKSHPVTDVYMSKFKKIGTNFNYEQLENEKIIKWDHFYLEIPDEFVVEKSLSISSKQSVFRDTRTVFKRSLEEISEESVLVVLELIAQNSLYRGEEWKDVLKKFLEHKKAYQKLISEDEKERYTWEQSVKVGAVIGRIRNHSMGTLLLNITEGMDLDTAVKKYEQIVAPANYKRPKPIFTKKMLEDAKKTITELGYMESLARRYATLDDITINNILFSNKDSAKRIVGAEDFFGQMEKDIVINPKSFSKVEEVSIKDFIDKILPSAKELEVFLENRHVRNMVSLIAPVNSDSKTMFKWENGFSWAYSGNITDSSMKERVKSAGGRVDGDLRFSIQWNDLEDWDKNDLDAHCKEPSGEEIFYSHRHSKTGGVLDVDIINPQKDVPAVENITWESRNTMQKGIYQFFVHQFTNRGGRNGFRAEIEFDGQIYSFEYAKELKEKENVPVADVTFDGVNFTIKEKIPSHMSSREVWNLKTNQFIPVSVVCYSPNYWDEQNGTGHKHIFFMLKDCINPEQPNGMFNEFLKEDLMKHKHVLEALGAKSRAEDCEDQLSGIGFSLTKRNDILIKVKGNSERVVKVKF